MADMIADGIKQAGNHEVEVVDIENILLGDLEEKIVRSDALIVGSPTINQNTLLPIYRMFAVISPLRDRSKLAAAFGSYGWSGEAVGIIENALRVLKLNVICEGVSAKFYPHEGKASQFNEFGKRFSAEVDKMVDVGE
jgi:flavorubredoxin